MNRLRSFPAFIFLLALILRLIPVLVTPGLGIGLDDMFQYDMLGRSIASGNGFRWYAPADVARLAPYLHFDVSALSLDPRGMLTTFRAPLYPAFIALIYLIFGSGPGRFFALRLFQAVLGAMLAPLAYFAATRALRPDGKEGTGDTAEKGARFAAWVMAVYPVLIFYPLGLATENLFILLLLASMLILLDMASRNGRRGGIGRPMLSTGLEAGLVGAFLGLAALTRSVILPAAAAAILWIAIALRSPRRAVIAACALIITLVPWAARNSLVAGAPTGIETSLGYNLYLGYNPQSDGSFAFGPSMDLLSILNDRTRDEAGMQRAMGFIAADPARVPYLALSRLGYFFHFDLRAFIYFYSNNVLGSVPEPLLGLILALLILPFGFVSLMAAGGATSLSWNPESSLLLLLFFAYLLPHVLVLSEDRFHLAILPILAIWGGHLWRTGVRGLVGRRVALVAASALVILLVANWGLELARQGPILVELFGPAGNQLYLPY